MELTIEQALHQGITAHKEGKLQDAERLYRAILRSQPLHPGANHNLGVLAVSENKVDAALPLFKTALKANPKKEQFWFSYIDALIKEQKFEAAKQVIEQVKRKGMPARKLTSFESQLIEANQDSESKLTPEKKRPKSRDKRKKLAETKCGKKNNAANNPSDIEINKLLLAYQNGQFDEAEKLAVSLTERFPRHLFAWQILGAVFGQTGRPSLALNTNQTAITLSPQNAEAHNNLGVTLKELGRLNEAEASYRQAIALKPTYTEAYSNLGNTLKELGRLDEAEVSYTKAIALKPDLAEAHSNLGITLEELGRLAEAEASCRQAIALKPDYTEAYSNLGNTLRKMGSLDEAEVSYTKAIALKPDLAEAHSNLGSTLIELRRFDEAEASYRQAIKLKPDCALAHSNLGITLKELGRLAEAEASCRQAIALKPDDALVHSNLARVLYQLGYKDLALIAIRNAHEISPEVQDHKVILSVLNARKSREKSEVAINDIGDTHLVTESAPSPIILYRMVEPELISSLYGMNSRKLDKTRDARFGNGKCSPDFCLFQDNRSIIQKLAEDLRRIMMRAVKSDVYILDSFFNILSAGGGSTPHRHLNGLDRDSSLNLANQKYSLVYYLSVGDQSCSEPGTLKLYDPEEDILPDKGMIIIIPATRQHSAVYNGKTDRVMIGVNFYSL